MEKSSVRSFKGAIHGQKFLQNDPSSFNLKTRENVWKLEEQMRRVEELDSASIEVKGKMNLLEIQQQESCDQKHLTMSSVTKFFILNEFLTFPNSEGFMSFVREARTSRLDKFKAYVSKHMVRFNLNMLYWNDLGAGTPDKGSYPFK